MCVLVHTAHILTAVCVLSPSAIRAWDPLREAALRLQYVFGAAVPGEHVPVSGKRQSVQLAAVQPLQQQHALLQQDQVRWDSAGGSLSMSRNIIKEIK